MDGRTDGLVNKLLPRQLLEVRACVCVCVCGGECVRPMTSGHCHKQLTTDNCVEEDRVLKR